MSCVRTIVGSVFFLIAALPLAADEYNKRPHLDPATSAKVNRVIAKSWLENGRGAESHINVRSGRECGNQVVGDFTKKNAPREVIIVAEDIINICKR